MTKFFEPELSAWRGRMPLWKVFWGHGVLVSSLLRYLHRLGACRDLALCRQRQSFLGLLARWLVVAWAGNTAMLVPFLQLDLLLR
jgi:hypothetical protein